MNLKSIAYQSKSHQWQSPNATLRSLVLFAVLLLNACSAAKPPELSPGHIQAQAQQNTNIPTVVTSAPIIPVPKPMAKLETYTVVVNDVPVKELLFSLARDASLNVDIHPGITGRATLNAVNQTLPQILDRIAKQVSLRYQLDGPNLVISLDTPYWRTYRIDYVNLDRDSSSETTVATQIATAGGTVSKDGGGSNSSGNSSKTSVTNKSTSHFWELIEQNVRAIVKQYAQQTAAIAEKGANDKMLSALSAATGDATSPNANELKSPVAARTDKTATEENLTVLTNSLSGIMTVFTTELGHRHIQKYVDQVLANAQKQVLIEVTIVEVELNDRYQAGVDWAGLSAPGITDDNGSVVGDGLQLLSSMVGANLATAPAFALAYKHTTSSGKSITTVIRALETFGDVKVLSSPKIMALNNQTALLKVVDEKVYFTVDLQIEKDESGRESSRTYTSEIHTVPVGMIMSVMPQINNNDTVTLSIRPTITRITGYATDPAPKLLNAAFDNLIPEIQVREMDSLLQVPSTNTVVLGGLMQNKVNKGTSGVPFLSSLPIVGNLFNYRDDGFTKTELVIFIKPTVIKKPDINGDFSQFRDFLSAGSNDLLKTTDSERSRSGD